jgi:tape measure domain-containing protein
MAETKFTIDASQAFATLQGLETRLAALEDTTKKVSNATRTVFSPGGDLARREVAALDQVQREYIELAAAIVKLKAAKENAFEPLAITTYAKAIDQAENEMVNLQLAAKATGVDLKKALEPPKGQGFGAAVFDGLKTAALSAAAGISFGAAISEGIRLNAEYEKTRTTIGVLLKDLNRADALLAKLNQFAAETPFGTDQINQAAQALLAFGESEATVITRLKEIGAISAGTGKDFNELTTIYGKARVAGVLYAEDINQLVEAGIPIVQQFAKQMGVSESRVKVLASEGKIGFGQLQTAFKNMTKEGGQFSGLLEAQSKTVIGLASTFRDSLSNSLRQAFAGVIPIIKELLGFLNNLVGATKSQSQALEEERVGFLGVANQIRLTNVGTEERIKGINTLKQQYPQFLGQINAEKVTNEQLQPILDKINQSYIIRIALQKQQEKLRPLLEAQANAENNLAKEQVSFNQQLARGAELAGVNVAAFKTQEEQVKAVTEALRKQAQFNTGNGQFAIETPLNEQARLLRAIEAAQSGANVQTNRQKQEQDKVNAALKEQDEITKQLKKTYGEVFDLATQGPAEPPPPPDPKGKGKKGKQKTAAEIAFENREKDLDKRQLLLNDLEDGLDKELAIIALHFDRLRLEYEKAGLDISALAGKQSEAEVAAISDFLFKQVEADAAALESSKKAGADFIQSQEENLKAQKATRDAEITLREERGKQLVALAKKTGSDEKQVAELQRQFDLATQKARLESELQFQQQLLAITGAGNAEQAQQISDTIAQIKAQIATIDIEASIPQAEGGKPKSIWALLGIDTSNPEGEAFAQQVEAMAQQVIASLQGMAQARTELAQAEVDASDERLSSLEKQLDQEIALATAGFASDVTLKRKQIEEEKKKNAAVKAELEKAKKSQMAIDTAIQASSLITSVANLFKSLSAIPFGAGIPIAIALSGLMLGFFIKSKVDAAKAAKARFGATGFIGNDGIVKGKYHTHGGETLKVERGEMVQVGDDGARKRVEVVRRERVTEYMDLLQAANKGDRQELALQALKLADIERLPDNVKGQLLQGANIGEPFTRGPEIRQRRTTALVFGKGKTAVNVRIEGNDSARTNELMEALLREVTRQGKAPRWSPDGKTKIVGNTKTNYV